LSKKPAGGKFGLFYATKLLREAGSGPAFINITFISLMRNQLFQAERMGVHALTIHSDNKEEWADIEEAITRNQVDILLISPERWQMNISGQRC